MKITRYSNWCEKDQLGGKDLKDGEWLAVTWPDGFTEEVKAEVVCSSYDISDHGHPYTVHCSNAYTTVVYRGQSIQVALLGLEARRIKK